MIKTIFKRLSAIKVLCPLYRATEKGFTSSAFYESCKLQGPTLTIIQTNTDHKFALFRDLSFLQTLTSQQTIDPKAFILSNNKVVKLQEQHLTFQEMGPSGPLLTIGSQQNPDLVICDKCDLSTENYGSLDICWNAHTTPTDLDYYKEYTQVEIRDFRSMIRCRFRVVEIEVFAV